jgi:large subunit ribosomal protein L30
MSKIIVKQTRSHIGEPEKVKKVMRGLGLKHIGVVKEHKDNNCIRGMINKVKHLVSYELKA